jgi:excisionase family DNA binding protein
MSSVKLTAKQVSELLQITEQAVRKWARENKIPHYKVGVGKVPDFRFDEEEVLKFFRYKNKDDIR